MSDINVLTVGLQNQLKKMYKNGELFEVDIEKDDVWDTYLRSFPEGTNPIYKERTQHDCNCCKQFVRGLGNVVSIDKNFNLVSIWDIIVADETFQTVADSVSEFVKSKPIRNVYRSQFKKVGTPVTRQEVDGNIITWHHMNAVLDIKYVNSEPGSHLSNTKANYDVLKRSVEEITPESIEVVQDLIAQNSIYRGEEFKTVVSNFSSIMKQFKKLKTLKEKDNFLWKKSSEHKEGSRFRNTVIGTLITDISDGMDLEKAVRRYEDKVAPHNYKRTKALITQGMINQAQKTIDELGIEDALYRRFAVEEDVTINNVLFADRSAKELMKGPLDTLKPTANKKVPSSDKVEEISIDDFVKKVLPKAESLEVFVENRHSSNFASIIAPEFEDAPNIFKWDNNFSWSYNGEVTDSIKERVKAAGGNVTGDVRVSLSWFNHDDLDIHVIEPNGCEIYYGRKGSRHTGGNLDVDMNAGGGETREPVENIVWPKLNRMTKGKYKVFVNNFSKRESKDVGFEVEMEYYGNVLNFSYPQEVRSRGNVTVVEFELTEHNDIKILKSHVPNNKISKEVWGVNTEDFQKVKMVMNSPNHWDDQGVGNKHWFFILEDCLNPDSARGFYNEFLDNDLNKHRKVFEVLASKMKTKESNRQLSGLGFSSTKKNELLCKVSGSFNRMLKIKF